MLIVALLVAFCAARNIETGGRVVDLYNGEHFDDILRDTPSKLRPGSLVAFFRSGDSECARAFEALGYRAAAETRLPARERLMIAKYDMDLHASRLLTEFSPEQDLPKRFGVEGLCPSLVYVPRKCNGHTEWCTESVGGGIEVVGCEAFSEQCSDWQVWNGQGDWVAWAMDRVNSEPWPVLDRELGSYHRQGSWILARERVTTNTFLRNNYMGPALNTFTKTGTKMMPIPEDINRELLSFYEKNLPLRQTESWDVHGQTQLNFHEVGTDLVFLDLDPAFRDRVANQMLKPVLEEWSGVKLRLTSFYGIREYFPGAWLRNHIDRIDTHIISATLSLLKLNTTEPWPIETVGWDGRRTRFEHRAGEMLLYESSTRPHGRPFRLKDGVHVGCFVHFAPADDNAFVPALSQGRAFLNANKTNVPYRSTESVTPENHVTENVLIMPETMEDVQYDPRPRDPNHRRIRKPNDKSFKVTFTNDLMQEGVDVYWVSHEGKPVKNAHVKFGSSVQITTFAGHMFFWGRPDAEYSKEIRPVRETWVTVTDGMKLVKASQYVSAARIHTDL